MATKKQSIVVQATETQSIIDPHTRSGTLNLTKEDEAAAHSLGIVITGDPAAQVAKAAFAINMATRMAVEAGYNLLAAKSACESGEFERVIEEAGFTSQRASEAMRRAKFMTAQPEAVRVDLLSMAPTKLLLLASADSEVIEGLLEDGEDVQDLNALSFRELRAQLRTAKAKAADAEIRAETAERKAEAEKKAAAKALKGREAGQKPFVIDDIQAEALAFARRAELAMEGLERQIDDSAALPAELMEWQAAAHKTVIAAVAAVGVRARSLFERLDNLRFDLADMGSLGTAPLSDKALIKAAEQHARIARIEEYEAALRKWKREQDRPRAKGRPTAKPELDSDDAQAD